MTVIDFCVGAALMNAMPHLVLGIWKGRMFSAFGFGNWQNKAYGMLCMCIALLLYNYKYGLAHLCNDGIFTGALSIGVIYILTGHFWYKRFNK